MNLYHITFSFTISSENKPTLVQMRIEHNPQPAAIYMFDQEKAVLMLAVDLFTEPLICWTVLFALARVDLNYSGVCVCAKV